MTASLSETCAAFADACNAILAVAVKTGVSNNVALQRLTYRNARNDFKLSANLAVRAVRRVSQSMTAWKVRGGKPKEFRPTSIDYDARIFDYRAKDETVSLTVIGGRIHVPLILGDYQRDALTGKKPTAAVVVRAGSAWQINIVVEDKDPPPADGPPMGVDLGIRNTAATSHGTLYSGSSRQKFKNGRNKVRASLQSRNNRCARKVLRRLSGRERRHITWSNHNLSKAIVAEAKDTQSGIIRMERLKDIRQRCKIRNRHTNRMMSGWSFGQLQAFVAYKAARCGIKIEYVDPAYTSQTCAQCGALGKRRGDVFSCTTCGTAHADIQAAMNIAAGGVVRHGRSKPTRTAAKCFDLSHVESKSPRL
jgi:IS605 OrfB family transposase